jgi:hypothetical protein
LSSSPKNRSSAVYTFSPRPVSCAREGKNTTPRGASLVSPSITQKSFNDKKNSHQSAPGRACQQTDKGFSASASTATSFQSPTTLKSNSIAAMTTTTRPPSAFGNKNLVTPTSLMKTPTSSMQESFFHNNRSHNLHGNGCSTGIFDNTSPKTTLLHQATTTTARSSTKLLSATTKSNIQASSLTSKTNTDVVQKQDENVDSKDSVAPRSWSHEELMNWMAKHELLLEQNMALLSGVNGQMVMRMSKAQLLDTFYGGGDIDCIVNKKRAETLFRRLRLESDRADRLLLKKRVVRSSTKGSVFITGSM